MFRSSALIIISALIFVSCTTVEESRSNVASASKDTPSATDYLSRQERIAFSDYDTNRDNKITSDEYVKKQEEIFNRINKTQGNDINMEELLIYWCSERSLIKGIEDPTLGPVYREMDRNHDGNITTEECRAYWIMRLKEYDLDKNKRINRYEYNSMMRDRFKNLLDGPDQNGHITNDDYNSFFPR